MNVETTIKSVLLENVNIDPRDICVNISGELTFKKSMVICEELLDKDKLNLPMILLCIHSEGGDVDAMVSIIQTMEQCRTQICTINLGVAASAAACIFCMGSQGLKIMTPHSYLMFHEVGMSCLEGKACDIKAVQNHYSYIEDIITKKIQTHLKLPPNYFEKMGHVDNYITPQKAKKDKLCDSVGYPTAHFDVKITGGIKVRDKRECEQRPPYIYKKVCRRKGMQLMQDLLEEEEA